MSKYVPDVLSSRWVIIAPSRLNRPDHFVGKSKSKNFCPFCPGNEHITPGEVFRMGKGEKDQKGWQVRVIPNKFPITDYHEVIIHSPHEDKEIEHLPESHVELILKAYRERFNYYRKKDRYSSFVITERIREPQSSILIPNSSSSHPKLTLIPSQGNL